MHTIRLRINDKVYDKLIWLLNKFQKDEVEIINEDLEFQQTQNYLATELDEIKQNKAVFFDISEVEERLDQAIKRGADKKQSKS